VSPVKYELGFYIPEDDILHSHRRDDLKSYRCVTAYDKRQPVMSANRPLCRTIMGACWLRAAPLPGVWVDGVSSFTYGGKLNILNIFL
jgi:hypothetical protein